MAEIRPFRCIRPSAGYAQRVAALPYDVYSREEAAAEASKDPLLFLNIDRPETQFAPEQDMYAPEVYQKADELLHRELEDGIFEKDAVCGYDLYEQTMNDRSQTGLVACASIDDYLNQVIKKHENTRAEKEADRVRHIDACSAQTGPIFLTYRRNPVIQTLTAEVKKGRPDFDFVTDDGIRHRGWHIEDAEQTRTIRETFAAIDRIYIADGHHRAASAVRVGLRRRAEHRDYDGTEEFNYFLSILFPDEDLLIMDYNRVVRDLNGLTEQEFLARVGEAFVVRPCEQTDREGSGAEKQSARESAQRVCRPRQKGELLMYLGNRWYRLTVRPEYRSSDPVRGLDVEILQDRLLAPVLGIEDPKTDSRIDFVGGVRGLDELVRRVHTDSAVAFAMYPTSIEELFAVADAGLLMPPKSTWFEPKLRSGLYIHEIER